MKSSEKITGVILAGGQAKRMNYQDKGLQIFKGKPLVSFVFDAMQPIVDEVVINANQNLAAYQEFGVSVVSDLTPNFDGALAGILAVMRGVKTDLLLVAPCDAPFISTEQLQRLIIEHKKNDVEITVACTGKQIQPVFLVVNSNLERSLENYLSAGNHKVRLWLEQHQTNFVDFGEKALGFENINTFDELQSWT